MYRRIIVSGNTTPSVQNRAFIPVPGYAPTMVLAPHPALSRYDGLRDIAEIVPVPGDRDGRVDLRVAMEELKALGVTSVLCEGGPKLAGALVAAGVVDRIYWLVSPTLFANHRAVAALHSDRAFHSGRISFDRVEQLDGDVLLSGRLVHV
jgi:riboflavin biosynthesis pyrimidine reductase